MNYKVTKIGLLNFWYFDDEEFKFYDGKLLLRGGNGSGKSVTMQSFIPLILDGVKTPSRLDPFGTKEKKIEDYLLGPADGEQKDEATGYLYMETYDKVKDKYVTVGIGLHARKGRPTDFWGFALKDGKRIGIDFNLYKSYSNKVLMTKKELRANIGIGNVFVESTKEYKSLVNDLLFGFQDLDAYDEFISVLLQLRSSKLSKEYNPTKLMGILSSVLQPLTDEDIRPISEAIEDNNKTREKIATLNSNIKALSNLSKVYQNYNEINLYNKALNVFEITKSINSLSKQISFEEEKITKIKKRLYEIDKEISDLENELVVIDTKLSNMDDKDLQERIKRLSELDDIINNTKQIIDEMRNKLDNSRILEKNSQKNINDIDNEISVNDKEIYDIKELIVEYSEDIKLNDIVLNIKDNEINFEYLNERITKYKNKLNLIKIKLEEKGKLEESLSKIEEEKIKVQKDLEQKELEKRNYGKNLLLEIDNFKDNLNLIDKQYFNLSKEVKVKIFDLIDDYNSTNYIRAKEIYQNEINLYKTDLIKEKSRVENKMRDEKNRLSLLNDELQKLKDFEELEYVSEELVEADNKLCELQIPFIQLYKVVEFKKSVSNIEKDKLEDLMISMNILNAKIVPKEYLDKVKNIKSVFLKEGTFKKNNILSYFDILDNDIVSKKEIENILSSISISEDDVNFLTPNSYNLDFLISYPSVEYKSKYIGLIKRREEHQRKILNKEEEIELKMKLVQNYENIVNEMADKLNNFDIILQKFPSNNNLEKIYQALSKIEILIDTVNERNKNLVDSENIISNDIRNKIEEINQIKDNIIIPLNLLSYKEALNSIDEISKNIIKLQGCLKTKKTFAEQKNIYLESLNNIRETIDIQSSELTLKNKYLNGLSSEKKAIEEVLSNPDNQKLLEELKILTVRKSEIPKENNSLREEKGKLENSIENLNNNLFLEKSDLNVLEIKLELSKNILIKEYNLNYVFHDDEINVDKILQALKFRENSDVAKAFENYIMAFNNYKQDLLDYRLNTREIFVDNEDLYKEYKEKGLDEKTLKQVLSTANRQDLETIYQGKKLNIYELGKCLKEAILESESYINNQERYLFEEVLLKTVGNKIRDRIDSSKEWVKKMNEIMRYTQIDSNLSFELEWKSKTAFSEDELDTKELVRLFKIDAGQLAQNDSDKLVNHFRSQIKKELEFNERINESYTNIIFKVLDYRNWFEFKIYYKRKSGERRELTNKVFSVLSGGERAKSMYVPLFAAVYAKILSARENALRLIALDEAFAGVDNTNIREMFDILGQLNLDYILTSQSLWGDYDTVKELSICELIKDEIHKTVAVRRYRWNGQAKEILEGKDLYE